MANSAAKKKRMHVVRQGKLDPVSNRKTNKDYANISQHVRKNESKKTYTHKHKYKQYAFSRENHTVYLFLVDY
ncbi:hypothetical protein [Longirhabdus pacifica]|uniref:hypothetical protein n=1 Tax=Longirhabdus pacifica TaxID=2305227 RepID=UPI00100903AA|nr:hypothetical protein [Longirhabdus pacifica]